MLLSPPPDQKELLIEMLLNKIDYGEFKRAILVKWKNIENYLFAK